VIRRIVIAAVVAGVGAVALAASPSTSEAAPTTGAGALPDLPSSQGAKLSSTPP